MADAAPPSPTPPQPPQPPASSSAGTPTPPPPASPGGIAPPKPPAGAGTPPKPPLKKKPADEKVYVWPELVAEEFVAALFFTALLCAWAVFIDSPLEEPADPNRTPNPSKAPWYFVGLQELLVYFDPWIAGVVLPTLIIVGLMVIPYIDNDNRGIGWYSIKERPFASTVFLTGLAMWFILIFVGYYCRGPSWGLYWPWEGWHVHKPFPPDTWSFTLSPRAGTLDKSVWPGVLLVGAYFGLGMYLPKRWFPKFYEQLGLIKYSIVMGLLLLMIAVPIKVFLRMALAIKYIVSFPAVDFNI